MFEVISSKDLLLVAFGSMPGAMLRYWITKQIRSISDSRYLATFLVNLASACALGLLLSFINQSITLSHGSQWFLFLGVGFLGSLSTFSTFTLELLISFREHRWQEGIIWGGASILGGLLALTAGYCIISYE